MTDAVELKRISDELHDEWFDVDQVIHDPDRWGLRLTIYPARVTGRFCPEPS